MIIRQQRYLELIRNCDLGLFADSKQSVVGDEDVALLRKYDHTMNSPTAGSLPIGTVQAAAQLQSSHCEDGMHWLDSCSRICVVGGHFSSTLESGWMGDNLEFFW